MAIGFYDYDVNGIVFNEENYKYEEEPEKAMWKDIANTLRILTKNDNICVFYFEDCDNYVLQFNPANLDFGDKVPRWVSDKEYNEFLMSKEETEDTEDENKDTDWGE